VFRKDILFIGKVCNGAADAEHELRHMPKIIEFLGYVPFECPEDLGGKLRYLS
jgi:hypothetical protein